MDDTTKPDARDLLNQALTLVKADLDALSKRKTRTTAEMAALSRYMRDLNAITKVDESEALTVQRELAKLPPDELARRLQEATGTTTSLDQTIRDASLLMNAASEKAGQ